MLFNLCILLKNISCLGTKKMFSLIRLKMFYFYMKRRVWSFLFLKAYESCSKLELWKIADTNYWRKVPFPTHQHFVFQMEFNAELNSFLFSSDWEAGNLVMYFLWCNQSSMKKFMREISDDPLNEKRERLICVACKHLSLIVFKKYKNMKTKQTSTI